MPFLDQGDIFYSCSNKDILKSLRTQQNKALRLIIGKKNWVDTLSALNHTPILSTSNRRNLNFISYAHKLSLNPGHLESHSSRSLRSNRRLFLDEPRSKCGLFDKSQMWN